MTTFKKPHIYASTILPMGKNNIEALNRFVGAHKRYQSPTEFGSHGEVEAKEEGSFEMTGHGIMLTPGNYDFCNWLHADVSEFAARNKKYGLSLYKSGLAVLGLQPDGAACSIDQIKEMAGQLTYKITDCIFPVLNEGQQLMLSAVLQTDKLAESWYKVQAYSLVVCEENPFAGMKAKDVKTQYSSTIEAYTDWIVSAQDIGDGMLFIGMAGMLYLGKRQEEIDKILRDILFLKSCNKMSHHVHSLLWSLRKRLQNLKDESKKGNYKTLKTNNEKICGLTDVLSKIQVYDRMLERETGEIAKHWKEDSCGQESCFVDSVCEAFADEVEKSIDRSGTISQLTKDLEVLSLELENRLELLMTRDSMTLNVILLVLTIISLLGIGEVAGFSETQWKIVGLVILPFGLASLIYLRNYFKNFLKG